MHDTVLNESQRICMTYLCTGAALYSSACVILMYSKKKKKSKYRITQKSTASADTKPQGSVIMLCAALAVSYFRRS